MCNLRVSVWMWSPWVVDNFRPWKFSICLNSLGVMMMIILVKGYNSKNIIILNLKFFPLDLRIIPRHLKHVFKVCELFPSCFAVLTIFPSISMQIGSRKHQPFVCVFLKTLIIAQGRCDNLKKSNFTWMLLSSRVCCLWERILTLSYPEFQKLQQMEWRFLQQYSRHSEVLT